MSWVTVIWSMISAACLTLAGVHLPVWLRDRTAWPSFFFSLLALSTAFYAFCEMSMLHAQTPAEYATAIRWAHVPIWLINLSLVAFVRTYLEAGRSWLGWSVIGLRTASLLPNFTTGQGLNYSEISTVLRIPFLAEDVSTALGTPNPWMLIGNLAACLLVVFVADASITAWRRGDRVPALTVGGSAVFFALAGIGQSLLVFWGVMHAPITISLFSLGLVLTMAYELSRNVLRASQLVQELRESEERMALAAEAAKLGIWVRDVARDTFWASPRTRELFGVSPTEPLDLDRLLVKVHGDDRDAVRQALSQEAEGVGEYHTEFRTTSPDGSIRWILAQGRVDFDAAHRPLRARGACSDITVHKQAEQEMIRLHQEIAHAGRVSVMGQLASALAHEINQPLGAILRNAEAASLLLQAAPVDLDEIRSIVEDILADDQRAGAVIDRMRAMLRRHDLEVQPLPVSELVGDVAALVRPDAAVRRVKVVVEIADDVPPVLGDRVHLQQVLLNLISNGMDAIDERGRKVRNIVVTAVRASAHTVEIAVSDSGSGIPTDRLEEVFGSFFTTKATGMGMGLSISRTLIESHGGRLWAENREEGGAKLRFTLPVADATA
ncbi:ATP-binding protein [Variovorax sp. J31P179]|uniref:ATP-binding protein n=1 Tax=Variovorax sp. J31P179 TaxID=3053508 RepID=UPI0025790815|nr:ATP-binding protein [Variovorax sp. J31P179]MDM0082899.1 ATP-binding protein [Variovorax sp. J31P179]